MARLSELQVILVIIYLEKKINPKWLNLQFSHAPGVLTICFDLFMITHHGG
jgi:hypothetical protein